ncbi:MAG: hypothetical protein ACR2P7_09865 [bacterium]
MTANERAIAVADFTQFRHRRATAANLPKRAEIRRPPSKIHRRTPSNPPPAWIRVKNPLRRLILPVRVHYHCAVVAHAPVSGVPSDTFGGPGQCLASMYVAKSLPLRCEDRAVPSISGRFIHVF